LAKIVEPGVRLRAERSYQQLDGLQRVRLEARRELLRESHQHAAVKLLRQILFTTVANDHGAAWCRDQVKKS
jgi:hypothetical protein